MNCLFTDKKCSCSYLWPCNNQKKEDEIFAFKEEKSIIDESYS